MARALLLIAACVLSGCLTPLELDALSYRCEKDADCGAGGACVLSMCRDASARRPLRAPHVSADRTVVIRHDNPDRWVALRWVARDSGVLAKLHLRVKVAGSMGCPYDNAPGFAAGTSGKLSASTHRARADGTPDMGAARALEEFQPCGREVKEQVDLTLGFRVERGEEYVTVVRNVDAAPAENFFSTEFLGIEGGLQGANGRNERGTMVGDAYYGLDPRELVGFSEDSGATWTLPGAPGTAVPLPTYLQVFADGHVDGQPYSLAEPLEPPFTLVYPKVPTPWTLEALGGFSATAGNAEVELYADDRRVAQATLHGQALLRAPLARVELPKGATLKLKVLSGPPGQGLRRLKAREPWDSLTRLGELSSFFLEGDALATATLFPLPMYEPVPRVASFTLLNADTDQPVAGMDPLPQNALISFAAVGTQNLTLRANTHPATIGSCTFKLDGTVVMVENNPPYAIAGDNGFGDFLPYALTVGEHVLTAVPYTEAAEGGLAGPPLSVTFSVQP